MKTKRSHLYKIAGLGLACALLISSAWHPSVAQTAPAMPARLEARNGVLPSAACPLDVYLLMDLTGSMGGELAALQANSALITSTLLADNPNTRFGIGWFQDYPISSYGTADDRPYVRELDLTTDTLLFTAVLNSLGLGNGWDLPESQLPALYNTVTGEGDIYIPAGQQANFRSQAAKVIVLVTDAPFHDGDYQIQGAVPPNSAQTAAALQVLPRAQVLGIFSNPDDPEYIIDLVSIVQASGSLAPAGGVDCGGDGETDIQAGDPLVCTVSFTGAGLPEAFIALVETVTDCRAYLPLLNRAPLLP
jgi:hypothetical protein